MKNSPSIFFLKSWKLLAINGVDSTRYLQGRLTQDISNLEDGVCTESLVLSPQGKILAQLVIFKVKDSYFALTPESEKQTAADTKDEILRFKVADQVEVEVKDTPVYFSTSEKNSLLDEVEATLPLRDFGYFVLGNEVKEASEEKLFSDLCVVEGYPVYGRDFNSSHTAGMIPLGKLVSFTKGCYAGQEVVEKSVALGKVNKKLVHLSSTASLSKAKPDSELFIDPEETKACGSFTSIFSDDSGSWGFALLKNSDQLKTVYSSGTTWKIGS